MVRVGLIGAGEIAQLAHLPVLRNLPGLFEITGITDVSLQMCRQVQQRFNIPTVFETPAQLIASPEVDAIMVLSSDPFHCEFALAALQAGKHVFVEKPLAMNVPDVEKLVEAQKRHPGQVGMVGFMRRYASPFLKAKEILQTSPLPIQYVRFRDIIREGDFYVRQTSSTVAAHQFADAPAGGKEQLAQMKHAQHSVALGQEAGAVQRSAYQMLLGLGCHSFSAVRELSGPPKKVVSVLTA
ncbi:MAG: Gfo/Idh/MocA family protein, partial [Oscillospiraceae bacterium]